MMKSAYRITKVTSLWICALVAVLYLQNTSAFQVSSTTTNHALISRLFRNQQRQQQPPLSSRRHEIVDQALVVPESLRSVTHDSDLEQIHLKSKSQVLGRFASFVRGIRRGLKHFRRRITTIGLALALAFSLHLGPAEAVSGGRSGGSFSTKSRAPIQRSAPSSGYRYNTPRPPRVIIHTGPTVRFGADPWQWSSSSTAVMARPRMSPAEIAVLTTAGAVIISGFVKNKDRVRREDAGPLGPGATAASITVALNVPDKDNKASILHAVRRATLRADTSQRKGVQDLISNVALELLRQERSIVSAFSQYQHYSAPEMAQRAFQAQSIQSRSKFDRETVNKFGKQNRFAELQDAIDGPRATNAVVTINLAIEGDTTVLPSIRSRQDLLQALSRIAADAQVEECLMSGEVLWAPDGAGETLSTNDLYVDYPNLIPL